MSLKWKVLWLNVMDYDDDGMANEYVGRLLLFLFLLIDGII